MVSDDRTFDQPIDHSVDLSYEKIDYSTFSMMSLKEFLSRPVKVQTLTWTPGNSLNATVSLQNYLGLIPIKHKLNQFSRIRFTQVITVSFTANPFYSGSLLLSALPLGAYNDLEPARLPLTPVNADFVRLTQRPHVFASVNQSQTLTLKLPYFNVFHWYTLNQTESPLVDNPYTIALNSINNLAHCNGATDPITVNVFFSLEDVDLEVPTTYYASSGETKKVSKTLSNLAHKTNKLGLIPILAPYSTPISLALQMGADVAKSLGYSRPFSVNDPVVRSHNPMSLTDQPDVRPKMCLSAANEISQGSELNLPPEILEMDIKKLSSRYSYLNTTSWGVSAAVDTTLLQSGVTPVVYINSTGSERHMPAISYLSYPFSHWSGSIKYKFQAIASGMHRGRLRITWDPYPTADINTPGFYSTPVTIILDLEKEHEVEFVIPFHSTLNTLFISPQTFPVSTGANLSTCNGYFTVSVLNVLNTPNTITATPVPLNVWIAAGDDYSIYRPGDNAKRLAFVASSGSVGQRSSIIPSLISHGEDISNIRSLVKREQRTYSYGVYSATVPFQVSIYELDRPVFRGTKAAGKSRSVTTGTGAKNFDYGINNFLTHYEMCFAARRGGYNQRYDVRLYAGAKQGLNLVDYGFLDVESVYTYPQTVIETIPSSAGANPTAAALADSTTGFPALESDTFMTTVSGRKPFHTNYVMLPNCRKITNWGVNAVALDGPAHRFSAYSNLSTTVYDRFISADEDYHLLFYCGPPILYFVGSPLPTA